MAILINFRCLENHHFCWSLLSPNPCLNWLRENLPFRISNITTDHFWRNPQTFRGWNGETARCGGRRWEQEPGAPAGTLFGGSQGQGAQPGKWQQNQLISPWKIKTTWTTSEMFLDKRRIRIWTGWFCSNFMHNKEWFFGWFLSAWLLPFQSETPGALTHSRCCENLGGSRFRCFTPDVRVVSCRIVCRMHVWDVWTIHPVPVRKDPSWMIQS